MLTAACMVKCWFTTWASVNKPLVLLGMDSPTPCSQPDKFTLMFLWTSDTFIPFILYFPFGPSLRYVLTSWHDSFIGYCSLMSTPIKVFAVFIMFFLGGGVWEKLVLQLLLSYCGLNHPLPSYLSRPQIVRFPVLPSSASSSCSFSIMQSKLRIEQG